MHVHVDFCLIPIGAGTSLSAHIARCQRILAQAGLKHELHPFGTCIEGDYDAVMAAIRRCHEALHADGVPRVYTTLKIASRCDRAQSLEDKVASVRRLLDRAP